MGGGGDGGGGGALRWCLVWDGVGFEGGGGRWR